VRIASRTTESGITAIDWFDVGGGESGWIAPSPKDSNIVFAGSYGGLTTRYDRRTGQQRDINPYPKVEDIGKGFAVIRRVIEQGQSEGVFRPEIDAELASWVVYGGMEEILTGWVMGRLPDGDEEVARAERTIFDVVCGGLAHAPVPA
jgi:hypothetical protein